MYGSVIVKGICPVGSLVGEDDCERGNMKDIKNEIVDVWDQVFTCCKILLNPVNGLQRLAIEAERIDPPLIYNCCF